MLNTLLVGLDIDCIRVECPARQGGALNLVVSVAPVILMSWW